MWVKKKERQRDAEEERERESESEIYKNLNDVGFDVKNRK